MLPASAERRTCWLRPRSTISMRCTTAHMRSIGTCAGRVAGEVCGAWEALSLYLHKRSRRGHPCHPLLLLTAILVSFLGTRLSS